jgi:hypothetical protein
MRLRELHLPFLVIRLFIHSLILISRWSKLSWEDIFQNK